MGCKKTGVYKSCLSCKKEVYVRPSEEKEGKKYCSQLCAKSHQKEIGSQIIWYTFSCKFCKTEFKLSGARRSKRTAYCSKDCGNKARRGGTHSGGWKTALKLKGVPKSKEHSRKVGDALRGRKRYDMMGERHFAWTGLTPLKELIRKSFENKQWKYFCFKRDGDKCTKCGSRKKIEVDHIIPFSFIIKDNKITTLEEAQKCKLLWDTSNGRTLCRLCHSKTDTYGEKAKRFVVLGIRCKEPCKYLQNGIKYSYNREEVS